MILISPLFTPGSLLVATYISPDATAAARQLQLVFGSPSVVQASPAFNNSTLCLIKVSWERKKERERESKREQERARERKRKQQRERGRERGRERVCVYVFEWRDKLTCII